jgi:hypothetical protein
LQQRYALAVEALINDIWLRQRRNGKSINIPQRAHIIRMVNYAFKANSVMLKEKKS